MGLVNGSFPSLSNGISQQPDSMRLPTQGIIQTNGMSSLMDGLGKRPPTEHLAKLSSSIYTSFYTHFIDRDEVEKYIVLVYTDHIQVADQYGKLYPVYGSPADFAYLKCDVPYRQIKCLTVADTTFILNRTIPTGMSNLLSPAKPNDSLVWVRAGNYKTNFKVTINTTAVNYETSATDPATIKTDVIASSLATLLVTALGAGWNTMLRDNVIWQNRVDGAAFTTDVTDSNGGHNMTATLGQVQTFSSLPDKAPNGYTVLVTGDIASKKDDYWVKFNTNGNIAFGSGIWKETTKPLSKYRIDPTSMPHTLIRKQDTTGVVTGVVGQLYFQFGTAPWSDRVCGDDTLMPPPSFIGNTLSDVFLHRNRLGFLATGYLVMSQSGNLYNFWRQTATTLLDDDTIDIAIAHERAVNLRHAISFNQSLVLFSDHTQFAVADSGILSPKSISIQVSTEYSSHLDTPPVYAENMIYFPFDNGEYSGMREYFVQGLTQQNDAKDITSHVSRYIKGSIIDMTVSPLVNMLFTITDAVRNSMWVYRWMWNGQDKVQSSWSQWNFGANSTLVGIGHLGDALFVSVVYADGTYLERIRVDPGHTDPYASYLTLVDRKVSESTAGMNVLYDLVQNQTTITAPYLMDPADTYSIVTRASSDPTWIPGRVVVPLSVTPQRIVVKGDVRQGFWLGRNYEFRYRFARAQIHSQTQISGFDSNVEGRLQIKEWTMKFSRTGYIRGEVTPESRDTIQHAWTGQVATVPGMTQIKLGSVPNDSNTLRFPVQSRNTNVIIEAVNDTPLPSYLVGAEWVGNYWSKAQRI